MSELHPTGFTVVPGLFTAVFEAIEESAYSHLADTFEPPSVEIRPISFDRISEEDKAARRVPLEIIGTERADLP